MQRVIFFFLALTPAGLSALQAMKDSFFRSYINSNRALEKITRCTKWPLLCEDRAEWKKLAKRGRYNRLHPAPVCGRGNCNHPN